MVTSFKRSMQAPSLPTLPQASADPRLLQKLLDPPGQV